MSRISIDVTAEEHRKLKALAAFQGKSIKEFVIERTLGAKGDEAQQVALRELERMLDERIRGSENGATSKRRVGVIFEAVYWKSGARQNARLRTHRRRPASC